MKSLKGLMRHKWFMVAAVAGAVWYFVLRPKPLAEPSVNDLALVPLPMGPKMPGGANVGAAGQPTLESGPIGASINQARL